MPKLYSLFLIALFVSLNGALQTACQSPTNSQQLESHNVTDKTAREQTVAFINVNIVPMDQETTLKNQTVIVRDGKIALVGAADQIKVPDNALKVDGRDQFLMPGLAEPELQKLRRDFEN